MDIRGMTAVYSEHLLEAGENRITVDFDIQY